MYQISGLLNLLKQAIIAVPSLRYALGIVGIIAAVALIRLLEVNYLIAIIGAIIMIILMVLLVIFDHISKQPSSEFKLPALVLIWFVLIIIIITIVIFFTSVFFRWPLDLNIPQNPAVYVNNANTNIEEGNLNEAKINLEEAISIFKKQKRKDNDLANAYYKLGLVYWRKYWIEKKSTFRSKAINNYQKSIKLNGSYWLPYSKLGLALFHENKLEEAKEKYIIASRLNPEQANPYYMLARIYSRDNDVKKACYHFNKALNINSDSNSLPSEQDDFKKLKSDCSDFTP